MQLAYFASPFDSFVLFSSVAARCLVVRARRTTALRAAAWMLSHRGSNPASGRPSTSVQWGPWSDAGMASGAAVNARLQASGLGLIRLSHAIRAFKAALQPRVPAVMSAVIVS